MPVVRRYQATERGLEIAQKSERKRVGTETRKRSHNRANRRYKKTQHGRMVERACYHRRRELAQSLDTSFSKEDVYEVYQRFDHKCFACNSQDNLSIDHHRPLSKGHPLSGQNAVLLCVSCNASKGSKQPEEFYSQTQLEVLNGYGIV
jgi:5-methylcytosine-specific restriction endonuclease McrA